jgi:MoxR-like ATPase
MRMKAVQAIIDLCDARGGKVTLDKSDPCIKQYWGEILKSVTRYELSKRKYAVFFDEGQTSVTITTTAAASSSRKKPVVIEGKKADRKNHTYVPPPFDADIFAILTDDVPHNIWLVGGSGTGKTEFVHHIAARMNRKVFQVNCREDMSTAAFLGDKTVEIDPDAKQNFIKFLEGPAIKAMQEGLDEDGNEVGEPGILFIDEAGACPAHIAIALNRLLETRKVRREVALDGDGGRVVRSHSKFRIICAANTAGRGITSLQDAVYTAQGDAMDIGTLNRITAFFRFGYNRAAEKSILQEKIGDDTVVAKALKIRDAIRDAMRQGKASTPFSTRTIVAIADLHRVLGDLPKAVYYACFGHVLPEEKPIYNEAIMLATGVDVMAKHESSGDMDFF